MDVDTQRADEILVQHYYTVVTSETVRREFESVRDRRQDIHDELLPYVKNDTVNEYEPNETDLTANDQGYVDDFKQTLGKLNPLEAARRVQERNRQLKQGYRELFETDEPLVLIVSDISRDPRLTGTITSIIENDDDARIICDAVEWTRDDGSGLFVTSDKDDMLPRSDSDSDTDEQTSSSELSDTFEGFLSGDTRSKPERINDAILQRYDSECCLSIFSVGSFLDEY